MTVELYTLGYVVDNLKSSQYAIKVLGKDQGMKLYVAQDKALCGDNGYAVIGMSHEGNPRKLWAIVDKE